MESNERNAAVTSGSYSNGIDRTEHGIDNRISQQNYWKYFHTFVQRTQSPPLIKAHCLTRFSRTRQCVVYIGAVGTMSRSVDRLDGRFSKKTAIKKTLLHIKAVYRERSILSLESNLTKVNTVRSKIIFPTSKRFDLARVYLGENVIDLREPRYHGIVAR